jgi:indolepyruvate ferredoxin oxidoreductase, alpha subunit
MIGEISGTEAVRLGVDRSCVEAITFVPGYPVTDLGASLKAEISVNEKVAMEIALGASATGARSMVVVKQMGMDILLDPMLISATHTTGAGIIVLVGDDLGPRGSQSEIDSRYFGALCELPVFDPCDPEALYWSIIEAYRLSEEIRAPAIVRITPGLLSDRCSLDLGTIDGEFKSRVPAQAQTFDRSIWEFTAMGRHQRHHFLALPSMEEASESSSLNHLRLGGDVGIIASGRPANLSKPLGVSLLSLGYAYPLPWNALTKFIDDHRLVLVAEEPEPVIESQLRMNPKIRGKLTGHLPIGRVCLSDIKKAVDCLDQVVVSRPQNIATAQSKGYKSICPDCSFLPLYRAVSRMGIEVAGDAGCCIRTVRGPDRCVDVAYGLGSAVAVASGFREKGIAVIGDYAFAHSGLQGLINAIWQDRDLLLVLIQNRVAAQTGGQKVPDLTALLSLLVPTRSLDFPMPVDEVESVLRDELAKIGPTAIIANGPCIDCK